MTTEDRSSKVSDRKDANTCIALGAGVGVLGATSAAITGAVCPLCIVVAPGLIGYGVYRRRRASDAVQAAKQNEE